MNVFRNLPSYVPGGFIITRDLAMQLPGSSKSLLAGIGDPKPIDGIKLASMLGELPDNCYIQGHCPFSIEMKDQLIRSGVRTILILRDPRDVVCSYENYIMNSPKHYLFSYLNRLTNNGARFMAIINGIAPGSENGLISFAPICDQYRMIEGWVTAENVLLTTFEQLVGEMGKGSASVQQDAVRGILEFISYPIDRNTVSEISSRLYSKESPTYFRGQIGLWRDRFDNEITKAFASKAGEAMRIFSEVSSRYCAVEKK